MVCAAAMRHPKPGAVSLRALLSPAESTRAAAAVVAVAAAVAASPVAVAAAAVDR